MAIEEDAPAGLPEWIVTYGDMMTLLLTFFVMLVSMSEVKHEAKYQAIVTSLREQFGKHVTLVSSVAGKARPTSDSTGSAQIEVLPVGEDPLIRGVIYFEDPSYALTEEHKRELHRVVEQLAGKAETIEIRGHTARSLLDAKTGLRDLWDLADRRCHSTREFLIEQGIEPNRLRLANAEANEPLYIGLDEERQRINSRVEIRGGGDGK